MTLRLTDDDFGSAARVAMFGTRTRMCVVAGVVGLGLALSLFVPWATPAGVPPVSVPPATRPKFDPEQDQWLPNRPPWEFGNAFAAGEWGGWCEDSAAFMVLDGPFYGRLALMQQGRPVVYDVYFVQSDEAGEYEMWLRDPPTVELTWVAQAAADGLVVDRHSKYARRIEIIGVDPRKFPVAGFRKPFQMSKMSRLHESDSRPGSAVEDFEKLRAAVE